MTGFFHLVRPEPPPVPAGGEFTYAAVGATRTGPPTGFAVDRAERVIGRGEGDFRAAVEAIRAFRMFDLGWVELLAHGPVAPGSDVVFASWQLGLWTLNACRVVYVVDERDAAGARYGFAYGTLAPHALAGEERFLATWDAATDEVRFEIYKFARPVHPVVRLVKPLTRRLQRRFSEDAIDAVERAVRGV